MNQPIRPEAKEPRWLRAIVLSMGTRLATEDVADLRFVWHEYEAAIGYSAIDPSKMHYGDSASAADPYSDDGVLGAIKRANRVRRVLERMPSFHATVLYRVYGPLWHHAPFGAFGDLAQIVEYTDSAERLSTKTGQSPRESIEKRLRESGASDFVSSMRTASERLLWKASDSYREAKIAAGQARGMRS